MKGMKFIIEDNSRYCLGSNKKGIKNYFSSDQLFSAIINNISTIYGEEKIEKIIKEFEKNIRISSMFYGLEIISKKKEEYKKEILFFPKPKGIISKKNDSNKEKEYMLRKRIKKISFVSSDAYRKIISSWDEKKKHFNFDTSNLISVGNKFLCSREELEDLNEKEIKGLSNASFLNIESRPRVKINRKNDGSEEFYYQEEMIINYIDIGSFIVKPFMYFIYTGDISKEVRAAINLIPDQGIGGKKSQGKGYFEGVEELVTPRIYRDIEYGFFTSLSTCYPRTEEVDFLEFYELDERSGYVFSNTAKPYRRKRIRVLKEGFITSRKIDGEMIDLKPEKFNKHSVFFYGKPLLIPLGGGQNET